jgi:hypothetical protein
MYPLICHLVLSMLTLCSFLFCVLLYKTVFCIRWTQLDDGIVLWTSYIDGSGKAIAPVSHFDHCKINAAAINVTPLSLSLNYTLQYRHYLKKKLFPLFCEEECDAKWQCKSSKKIKCCPISVLFHEHISRSNWLFTKRICLDRVSIR